jgi:hypothetical protein
MLLIVVQLIILASVRSAWELAGLEGEEMSSRSTPVRDVTVRIDGVTHRGMYFVHNSIVYVRSPLGSKATQVSGSPALSIAKVLLSELVRSQPRDIAEVA